MRKDRGLQRSGSKVVLITQALQRRTSGVTASVGGRQLPPEDPLQWQAQFGGTLALLMFNDCRRLCSDKR